MGLGNTSAKAGRILFCLGGFWRVELNKGSERAKNHEQFGQGEGFSPNWLIKTVKRFLFVCACFLAGHFRAGKEKTWA